MREPGRGRGGEGKTLREEERELKGRRGEREGGKEGEEVREGKRERE